MMMKMMMMIHASNISSDRLWTKICVFFLLHALSGCHRPVSDGAVQTAIILYDILLLPL